MSLVSAARLPNTWEGGNFHQPSPSDLISFVGGLPKRSGEGERVWKLYILGVLIMVCSVCCSLEVGPIIGNKTHTSEVLSTFYCIQYTRAYRQGLFGASAHLGGGMPTDVRHPNQKSWDLFKAIPLKIRRKH